MAMAEIFEIAVAAFLVIAGVFGFVGSFGLIKLTDAMSRLHAALAWRVSHDCKALTLVHSAASRG